MTVANFKVMVVDDELPALTNMHYALSQHSQWQLIASCHSTAQARAILQCESVDLLLLDIEMPKQTGLEFARELSANSKSPIIVFVTAYNRHAVDAFQLFALDYLLKPFDDERFAAMLMRAEKSIADQQILEQNAALRDYVADREAGIAGASTPTLSHIVVRSMGKIERILVDDIIWIGTAANYVEIHLQDRVILHRTTITSMEERLSPTEFIRLHRTAIVRLDTIRALEMGDDGVYSVRLINNDMVKVSENSVRRLKQLFTGKADSSSLS